MSVEKPFVATTDIRKRNQRREDRRTARWQAKINVGRALMPLLEQPAPTKYTPDQVNAYEAELERLLAQAIKPDLRASLAHERAYGHAGAQAQAGVQGHV
jgi:hypothetical protein